MARTCCHTETVANVEARLQGSSLGEEGENKPLRTESQEDRSREEPTPGGQGEHSHSRQPSHRHGGGAAGTTAPEAELEEGILTSQLIWNVVKTKARSKQAKTRSICCNLMSNTPIQNSVHVPLLALK